MGLRYRDGGVDSSSGVSQRETKLGGVDPRPLCLWRDFASGVGGDRLGRVAGMSPSMLMYGELMSVDGDRLPAEIAEAL